MTDAFLGEFGLGICGVGGSNSTAKKSWYLKVNHKNPELGGESVKLKKGDEVLWALAPFPYPNELALEAPAEATPGVPFEVQVYSFNDKGKRKPAAGVTVSGSVRADRGRREGDGRPQRADDPRRDPRQGNPLERGGRLRARDVPQGLMA